MKVILSRKGFDSSNGGCPSPIMPDGTLLSMPIPSDDKDSYDDLSYCGTPYSRILQQLAPKKTFLDAVMLIRISGMIVGQRASRIGSQASVRLALPRVYWPMPALNQGICFCFLGGSERSNCIKEDTVM